MKRKIAVLMCLLTLLSLFGCNTADSKIPRGTLEGNTYKSDYTGIVFTKSEEMIFSSDEDLAYLCQVKERDLRQNKFGKTLAKTQRLYDMHAVNPETGTSVVVGYENLLLSHGSAIGEEEYISILQSTKGNFAFGITEEVTLGGSTYKTVSALGNLNGIEIFMEYYVKSYGDYISFVEISGTTDEEFEEIFNMFS